LQNIIDSLVSRSDDGFWSNLLAASLGEQMHSTIFHPLQSGGDRIASWRHVMRASRLNIPQPDEG
jgi:hypothetical protein